MTGGKFHFTFGLGPAHAHAETRDEAAEDSDGEAALAAAFSDSSTPYPPSAPDYAAHGESPETEEVTQRSSAYEWMIPAFLSLLAVAWTGWFAQTHADGFATLDATLISGLIGLWAGPVMLLAVLWLIIQRSSRREAARFADAARALSEESARLEDRLTVVNRELSLSREFVAAQARDLDSVGRLAVERISVHADRLAALVRDNGAQVESIGNVSATALENMERLRGQLPVMTSAAKDVTNHIGNAGRTAAAQVQEMIAGFNRLNEFGHASERHVVALRTRVDEALAAFAEAGAALDRDADARVSLLANAAADLRQSLLDHHTEADARVRERAAALASEIAATRDTLDQAEAENIASLRARLGALRDESNQIARALREGEQGALAEWRTALAALESECEERATRFDAEAARRRAAFEDSERDIAASRASLLARLDAEEETRRARQEAGIAAIAASGDDLAQRLHGVEAQVAAIARNTHESEAALGQRLEALASRLDQARRTLATTEDAIERLTDHAVRLLELIQAGARHSGEDLANAIGQGEARLEAVAERARSLRETVSDAHRHGEELSAYVLQSHERLGEARAALFSLHDDLDMRTRAHGEALGGLEAVLGALRDTLGQLDGEAREAAARAEGELAGAIATLGTAVADAAAAIESRGAQAVRAVADQLGEESATAIERAIRLHMAEVGGRLEQAAAHASGISREATVQLRDQLVKVDELVGNLEARVGQARARAEEQVDNDFARRAALITDSLNSNAIDIAKALDTDVSDQSWASYLRGDRGIFTRRAVRLLDIGDAKSVAQIYENDGDFREHVSQYIHDFEAMLRQLLSTRDGHALSVTLLSSDMGKLYVALAQSIERLRA